MKNKIISLILFGILISGVFWYFSKRTVSIYITRSATNIPHIPVKIEGNTYSLALDSGSYYELDLRKEILERLEKKRCGTFHEMKVQGNIYACQAYLIPEIKIGNQIFKEILAKEIDPDSIFATTFDTTRTKEEILENKFGFIGRPLIEQMHLLLDFRHGVARECRNINSCLPNAVKLPLERGVLGFLLSVETDLGTLKFALDTGSTTTLIRSSLVTEGLGSKQAHGMPVFTTNTFVMGGKEFGVVDLHLFEITPEYQGIDGILGMDFLGDHALYVDTEEKLLYIGN